LFQPQFFLLKFSWPQRSSPKEPRHEARRPTAALRGELRKPRLIELSASAASRWFSPTGTVVVPIKGLNGNGGIVPFTSSNGGKTWSGAITVADINFHSEEGNLRSSLLPSAQIDGAGKDYVVWTRLSFPQRLQRE
jgi:hypothetical protein